jgi:hypothetical protein
MPNNLKIKFEDTVLFSPSTDHFKKNTEKVWKEESWMEIEEIWTEFRVVSRALAIVNAEIEDTRWEQISETRKTTQRQRQQRDLNSLAHWVNSLQAGNLISDQPH